MCATVPIVWFQNLSVAPKGNPYLLNTHSRVSPSPRPPLKGWLSSQMGLFWMFALNGILST